MPKGAIFKKECKKSCFIVFTNNKLNQKQNKNINRTLLHSLYNGAIFKITCKKLSNLIFVVNMKFS